MHTLRAFYCHEQIIECTLFEHSIVRNKMHGLQVERKGGLYADQKERAV